MKKVETLKSAAGKFDDDTLLSRTRWPAKPIDTQPADTAIDPIADALPTLNSTMTYYEVLGIAASANETAIVNAWRERSKIFHPDRGGDGEAQSLINSAYRTLINPGLKANYDARLSQKGDDNERFKISTPNAEFMGTVHEIAFVRGVGFTNDPNVAASLQGLHYIVEDRQPAEAGGMSDESLQRFKVEIPAGRKFAGGTFVDRLGLSYVNGIAYTDNNDSLRSAKEMAYVITDRDPADGAKRY